ncbi:MAG: hypothetical protein P8I55_03855 [Crocinitomix sp.]|nr:hypothetical protein [Crocinitomix sp.]
MEDTDQEQNFWDNLWKNASGIEKLAAALIVLSFFVGTFDIMGDMAIVGVIMAGAGTAIALFKKNWYLAVAGAIDFFILLSYMNDIAEINRLF